MSSEREQRRAEAIRDLREIVQDWRDAHGLPVFDAQIEELVADRLFGHRPAYCPYDCSGCHDDECPCSNCDPEADQ